jgi:hypothetical protein
LRGAVGGIDAAGRGLRGQLLDLSLGTASIVDKNDSSSVHHHHRLSLEHRLSIANTASGEKIARATDPVTLFMTSSQFSAGSPVNRRRGVASSWNAFYSAQRSPGHGIAVRHGYELEFAFPAGAIIDENGGAVSHIQRFLLDDDLGIADAAHGDEREEYSRCVEKRLSKPNEDRPCAARRFGCAEEGPVSHFHCLRSR